VADRANHQVLLAVDTCVERLLQGHDWRSALPDNPSREEVAMLLETAEKLLKSADFVPVQLVAQRHRVWDRLVRVLHRIQAVPWMRESTSHLRAPRASVAPARLQLLPLGGAVPANWL
jgi:hypothetical protein